MTDLIRLKNLLKECLFAAEARHEAQALVILDQARGLLLPKPAPWAGRPEDDPARPQADRAAWREAR